MTFWSHLGKNFVDDGAILFSANRHDVALGNVVNSRDPTRSFQRGRRSWLLSTHLEFGHGGSLADRNRVG